jgi:hypothetical protein
MSAAWLRQYVERVDAALNNDSADAFAALIRISPNEYDLVRLRRSSSRSSAVGAVPMPAGVSAATIRAACAALGAPYDEIVAERVRWERERERDPLTPARS